MTFNRLRQKWNNGSKTFICGFSFALEYINTETYNRNQTVKYIESPKQCCPHHIPVSEREYDALISMDNDFMHG